MTGYLPPSRIIRFDTNTRQLIRPTLLLESRAKNEIKEKVLGNIGQYSNFHYSFNGNTLDEISFDVHKIVNNITCPIWDEIIDEKIVEVKDYGRFEIQVSFADAAEEIKTVTGVSLETELGQVMLREFHINDDDAMTLVEGSESASVNFDKDGNFLPTYFYNANDTQHSLMHRVLEKCPHWSLGYVTPYVTKAEDEPCELSSQFQRTYTVDGTSVYDFLTGDIANETNVIFIFNTLDRTINVYSLYDCVNSDGDILEHAVGEDTTIFISKDKLANSVQINSNKDEVKNCFFVSSGDELVDSQIAAVTTNGSRYIYNFSPSQLRDMPDELRDRLEQYQKESSAASEEYHGENGIYQQLVNKQKEILYEQSTKSPNVSLPDLNIKAAYEKLVKDLKDIGGVGVYRKNTYSSTLYTAVTNNVVELAKVLVDVRCDVEVVDGTTSLTVDGNSYTWSGAIRIKRRTDETQFYPKANDINEYKSYIISLPLVEDADDPDKLLYTQQKVYKALMNADMAQQNFDVSKMSDTEFQNYYSQFSSSRLKGFASGYQACTSTLSDIKSDVVKAMYNTYQHRYEMVNKLYEDSVEKINKLNQELEVIIVKQRAFQEKWNFRTYLGEELYKVFTSYLRESDYTNQNYISDGIEEDTSALIQKAKDLLDVANKELKKACVVQRTISADVNNLFALPEFKDLYDNMALYNYIHVKAGDEIFKMRVMGIEWDETNVTSLSLTFSDTLEAVGIEHTTKDVASILNSAQTIATSYNYTAKQAGKGSEAKGTFQDLYQNGLNAAKIALSNSNNNEVTMTQSGIICRRMTDEGQYDGNQLRITSNMIAYTKDAWKSVSSAFGELDVYDPTKQTTSKQYGLIADAIVGRLLIGERAWIGNENGSVQITGDGIVLDGGSITWKKNEDGKTGIDISVVDGLDADLKNLQSQIDGSITTWFYDGEPTLLNEPAKNWKTSEDKNKQLGDLYYDNKTGYAYRFQLSDNIYSWIRITDSDITKALADAKTAQDTADGKRRVFVSQPIVPYDIGDLWVQGENGDIMRCCEQRLSGDYIPTDWVKASKYTDNSALDDYKEKNNAFNTKVQTALTGSATTAIGSDYMIAPYIGGGYSCIMNKIDGRSVIIDPMETGGNNTKGYIFKVTNKNGETTIGADSDGNAMFKGIINAGVIQSENYDVSSGEHGMKLNLSDGTWDSKYTKINSDGKITVSDITINDGTINLTSTNSRPTSINVAGNKFSTHIGLAGLSCDYTNNSIKQESIYDLNHVSFQNLNGTYPDSFFEMELNQSEFTTRVEFNRKTKFSMDIRSGDNSQIGFIGNLNASGRISSTEIWAGSVSLTALEQRVAALENK